MKELKSDYYKRGQQVVGKELGRKESMPCIDSAQDHDSLWHGQLQNYCPCPLDFFMSERDFTILPLTALVQIFSSACTG